MNYDTQPLSLFSQLCEGVLVGVSCVDCEGRTVSSSQLYLRGESTLLVLPRCVFPVIVEPRLADRDAARVRGQPPQLGQVGVVEAARFVGMAADGRVHLGKGLSGS